MVITIAGLGGCASGEKSPDQGLAAGGPVILNQRVTPDKVELNKYMQAKNPQQIFAEVQDVTANVSDVRLKFLDTPIEIPMEKIGATTWRASIPADQLKRMAVSGKTMNYKANVVARDEKGDVAVSKQPLEIKIDAPEFNPDAG